MNPHIAYIFYFVFLWVTFPSFFVELFVASLDISNGIQPTEQVFFGIHFKAIEHFIRKKKRTFRYDASSEGLSPQN